MNFNLKAAGALLSRAKQVFENIGKKLILKKMNNYLVYRRKTWSSY